MMSRKNHASSEGLFSVTSSMCVFAAHPGLRKAAAISATSDVQTGCQLQCNVLQCLQHRCTTEYTGISYIFNCNYRLPIWSSKTLSLIQQHHRLI